MQANECGDSGWVVRKTKKKNVSTRNATTAASAEPRQKKRQNSKQVQNSNKTQYATGRKGPKRQECRKGGEETSNKRKQNWIKITKSKAGKSVCPCVRVCVCVCVCVTWYNRGAKGQFAAGTRMQFRTDWADCKMPSLSHRSHLFASLSLSFSFLLFSLVGTLSIFPSPYLPSIFRFRLRAVHGDSVCYTTSLPPSAQPFRPLLLFFLLLLLLLSPPVARSIFPFHLISRHTYT